MGTASSIIAFSPAESYILLLNSIFSFILTILVIGFIHNNEKILKIKLSGVKKVSLSVFVAVCFIISLIGISVSSMAVKTWDILGGSLNNDD